MRDKNSSYIGKSVNPDGNVNYTDEENQTWQKLITRQLPIVQQYASDEYLHALELLKLPNDHIPKYTDISSTLNSVTGWSLTPVPAIIPFTEFFNLLAHKQFPVTTFIRHHNDIDYLQEPDVFHELFGHSPLLITPEYANFTQRYGELGANASAEDQELLARLYWYTIEFGLINTAKGLRAYGSGILSSMTETIYSVTSAVPVRKKFNAIEILRTPFQIDKLQTIYYVINSMSELYNLQSKDIIAMMNTVKEKA